MSARHRKSRSQIRSCDSRPRRTQPRSRRASQTVKCRKGALLGSASSVVERKGTSLGDRAQLGRSSLKKIVTKKEDPSPIGENVPRPCLDGVFYAASDDRFFLPHRVVRI